MALPLLVLSRSLVRAAEAWAEGRMQRGAAFAATRDELQASPYRLCARLARAADACAGGTPGALALVALVGFTAALLVLDAAAA